MKILYADCFVIGSNPSNTGGGYIVCDENNNIIDKETILKRGFTNNEGELLGVLRASELIDSFGTIYTDSKNTIYWSRSGKSKARPDLNHIMARVKKNIQSKNIKLLWIGRDLNKAGQLVENNHQNFYGKNHR
jgi:ribonuclease HI